MNLLHAQFQRITNALGWTSLCVLKLRKARNCSQYILLGFVICQALFFHQLNAQCPVITGVLVNSCGGNTNEGQDEYFTFRNGATPLDINNWIVTFPSGAGINFCNNGCGANTWQMPNPSTASIVAALTPTCPGLILEPPGGIIPPFASVMAFCGAGPVFSYDFCGSCNTGPVYAVFTSSLSTTGKFSNTAPRTLRVDFGGGCTDTAFYDPVSFIPANTDGNYVSYDYMTGQPTYITQPCNGCITLPVRLIAFEGSRQGNRISMIARFDTEGNRPESVQFLKSLDGINFSPVEWSSVSRVSDFEFRMNESVYDNKSIYYKIIYKMPEGIAASSESVQIKGVNLSTVLSDRNVVVYPNPGKGLVWVSIYDIDVPNELLTVELLTAEGKRIFGEDTWMDKTQINLQWDLSNIPPGYYIIKVSGTQTVRSLPCILID